jgi:predicted helicase
MIRKPIILSFAIFKTFSLGVSTNRDTVVYDFNRQILENVG